MKKKVLVVFTGGMYIGGVERSLIGLLDSFDYSKYEVDLFLYAHSGELFKDINTNVHLLTEINELAYLRESLWEKFKHGCYLSFILRIFDQFKKNRDAEETWGKIVSATVPKIDKHYDLAIGFFRPFDLINNKVTATTKIGWIHTDYSKANKEKLMNDYAGLDYCVAVSDAAADAFLSVVPEYSRKTIVCENILSPSVIKQQATEKVLDMQKDETEICLLSIGRFCTAKNFDSIPEICRYILDLGIKAKWYLIGYGKDEGLIRRKILEFNVEDSVLILGKKENPYPYIRSCDIYIQPSRFEGKAVTVREAQILGKPVIITNYPTASSQVENGIDGVIVPMDNKKCAEEIGKVINDKQLLKRLSFMCSQRDYSNSNEIKKLYGLM